MITKFREINFPSKYKYSSDSENIPLEFYNDTFPVAKKIDLFLGYFSSNAIKVLSKSFAEFVVNGGEMRIITNHVFSLKDKENLIDYNTLKDEDKIIDIFNDLEKLEFELSDYGQHFFDCLKYLQKHKRLIIQPVKFNNVDLSHCKRMVLYDGYDYISTDGSINFTLSALTKNSESFEVNVPWEGNVFRERVDSERIIFEKVINGEHTDYKHISSKNIEVVINNYGNDKDKQDLLEDSIKIDSSTFGEKVKQILKQKKERFIKKITELKIVDDKPHFPIFDGKISRPRPYQVDAYDEWVKNNHTGIFAMATGTGKTITSLNVLLEQYKINGYYNAIILVPTQILVNQWINECKKFNFKNIFSTYDSDWVNQLKNVLLEKRLGINSNFIFISTYASYNGNKFQLILKNFKCPNTILIADEAHNLGTKRSISNFLFGINKRIGLSATPNRNFDESGTSEIENYFNSFSPRHTYCFSMINAINNKFLTPYYYYPKFIKLNESEMEAYAKYSEKLLKFFDFEKGTYRDEASNLLIQRKRIIHQAANKKLKLLEILKNINNKNFKHTIVYVPEGFEPDYSEKDKSILEVEDIRIIDDYNSTVKSLGIKTHQIIGGMGLKERQKVLDQFNDGLIQVLTAMKTLDEGVDIPATKCAIFCASTGNPRQFIQRRGRILRKSKGKKFATVYDLIIEPNDHSLWDYYPKDKREKLQKMEINIFRNELYRVANFLYASKNLTDLHLRENNEISKLIELTELYNLDIFELINNLIETDTKSINNENIPKKDI